MIDDTDDADALARKRKPPVVMVSGKLRELGLVREGGDMVYSARVEFLVHRMPGQAILATVAGSASAKTTPEEAKNKRHMLELREAVLDAAISSAIRRAPKALMAAAE